jgi:hypothetical protein
MLLAVAACQPREKVPEATVDVVKVTATQAETRSVVGESQMGGQEYQSSGNQMIRSGCAPLVRRMAHQA